MTTIESTEYHINRAAKRTMFKDIDAIYYLGYYAASEFSLESLVEHIESKNWATLIYLTKYNSQDDVYWIVGFRLQSNKFYLGIMNDPFELLQCDEFMYTKEISEEELLAIPFVHEAYLAQPLNPTFFLKRLFKKLFP